MTGEWSVSEHVWERGSTPRGCCTQGSLKAPHASARQSHAWVWINDSWTNTSQGKGVPEESSDSWLWKKHSQHSPSDQLFQVSIPDDYYIVSTFIKIWCGQKKEAGQEEELFWGITTTLVEMTQPWFDIILTLGTVLKWATGSTTGSLFFSMLFLLTDASNGIFSLLIGLHKYHFHWTPSSKWKVTWHSWV